MMELFKRLVMSLGVIGMIAGTIALLAPAPPAQALECKSSFLTFPAWYDGLLKGDCTVRSPSEMNVTLPSGVDTNSPEAESQKVSAFIFRIVLNIIEILLQVVGYAAVGYIIYGGFKYLTSAGSADRITAGRKIITNSLIGLVISFLSVGIVNLVTMNIEAPAAADCSTSTNGRVDANCVGIAKVDSNQAVAGVLTTVYYAAGIAAIIVIIISAVFYVISQGEPAKTKRAKDGILYAVVGLVVILLAFIITNFVVGRF